MNRQSSFSISDVQSLRANNGSVGVDIGYLENDDHLNAFIEIFSKFVQDNEDIIGAYENASIVSGDPYLNTTTKEIIEKPRDIARALYMAHKPVIKILLAGKVRGRQLIVGFDNPSFEFSDEL